MSLEGCDATTGERLLSVTYASARTLRPLLKAFKFCVRSVSYLDYFLSAIRQHAMPHAILPVGRLITGHTTK